MIKVETELDQLFRRAMKGRCKKKEKLADTQALLVVTFYPSQGENVSDAVGDHERGLGTSHRHIQQVPLVRWNFIYEEGIT